MSVLTENRLDPEIVERIEGDLMLTVYEARRLARRRLLGLEPPPAPDPRALDLLRDARSRQAALRESAPGS